jgi:prepilin-type N-terminal cleavage/methylation domain-containing protein
MMARLRHLHARQTGFTLPELLAAMLVGLVVLMAAFMLLDHATSTSKEISDRQDTIQRGRRAMERMVTVLRSQVCLGESTEPIIAGDADSVTFYANLSSNPDTAQQRRLVYDPAAGSLTEYAWSGTGTYPDLKFPTKPTETRSLLDSVGRMIEDGKTQPIFRYYTYDPNGAPGALTELAAPLSSDNASRIVMVRIAFFAKPDDKAQEDRSASSLQSTVYVRLADPTRPAEGPRCL